MRTCYCKKCGTANEIEETMEKFFCANCGTENSVPQKTPLDTASKPVSGDKPAETSSFIYGSVDTAASKEPDEKQNRIRPKPYSSLYIPTENRILHQIHIQNQYRQSLLKLRRKRQDLLLHLLYLWQ